MTPDEKGEGLTARDVIAKALAAEEAVGQPPPPPPPSLFNSGANRILAALNSAGLAIVPVIPSDEMATAGHMATDEVSYSDVLTIYRAMLQAAPGPT